MLRWETNPFVECTEAGAFSQSVGVLHFLRTFRRGIRDGTRTGTSRYQSFVIFFASQLVGGFFCCGGVVGLVCGVT